MSASAFALFDTPVGRCAVAWSGLGIAAVQLPEQDQALTRARLCRRFPQAREGEPPPPVALAIAGMRALLRGQATDLSAVELDMSVIHPFPRRVYEVARSIPPGETRTYGEVAALLGEPGAARAVGRA